MKYTDETHPMIHRLNSHSRAALVSYLCVYAIQHPSDAGAFRYWLSTGAAFDPYGDTRAGRRLRRDTAAK